MNKIENFIKLSKYAGERFDLVQAAGGNSSVKISQDLILIKESGCYLSEIDFGKGYIGLNTKKVMKILSNRKVLLAKNKAKKDDLANNLLKDAVKASNGVPSIEIFLHTLLYTYTLHTHPLVVSAVVCRDNTRKILQSLFSENIVFVEYKTPGIELGIALQEAIEEYQAKNLAKPKIIFLQNHGLIVSSDDVLECIDLLEKTLLVLEKYLNVNLDKYKLTNKISDMINSLNRGRQVSYVSCDKQIQDFIVNKKKLFSSRPICPDGVVYCAASPVELKNLNDRSPLIAYLRRYLSIPRIIIYKKDVFFIASNIKKAREIEDVLKFNILSLDLAGKNINFLADSEVNYLSGWKSEIYRRKKD